MENRFMKSLSSGKTVLVFIFLLLVMNLLINGKPFGTAQLKELTKGAEIPDMVFNYNVSQLYSILARLGEDGRAFYQQKIMLLDIFFPLSYALFLTSCFFYFRNRLKRLWAWLFLIPVLAASFDYLENICFFIILKNFPVPLTGIAWTANLFTMLKFCLISASYLMLLTEIILVLLFRKRDPLAGK